MSWQPPNWGPPNWQPPNWETSASGGTGDDPPDAFAFVDQFGLGLAATATSNAITVTGIDSTTSISVSNGTYSINGGDFTSDTGSVGLGDEVRARHTSSASYSTAVSTVVTIGGVSDTFTSLTASDPEAASGTHAHSASPGGMGRMMGRA
jgi:hypothetical protein